MPSNGEPLPHPDGALVRHAQQVLASTATLCLLFDDNDALVYANRAARQCLGEHGESPRRLFARDEDIERVATCRRSGAPCVADMPLRTIDGVRWHTVEIRRTTRDAAGDAPSLLLIGASDVDARRLAEERARLQTRRDRLTGLSNRVWFMHELETRLYARADDERFGVLVVDLDRFKQINDGLGCEAGDRLLVEFARRLTALAGAGSLIGRFDGDEFVIASAPSIDAEALARRILDAMASPLQVHGQRLHVLPSIGVCLCPEHGRSVEDLLGNADMAMSAAKRERRGIRVFDEHMSRSVREALVLENDLIRAIRHRQFEACYQPRVALDTERVTGFEALVRWHHPERGLLMPDTFIDAAEQLGLIADIGDQVMLDAMRQQSVWARAGHDVTISINVSAHQLGQRRLLAAVAQNLALSGCDPHRIELEITESALVGDIEDAVTELRTIAALGIRIALDDFGTGYSNLAHLDHYPLATLKIDRAFVIDPALRAVLEAIIRLGEALGLNQVAEGVETPEQVRWLVEQGVEEGQGYLFGRAMSAADATAHLAEHPPRTDHLRPAA